MKSINKFNFLFFIVLFTINFSAQNKEIDSLKNVLKNYKKKDTTSVNILNLLAQSYSSLDFNLAEEYAIKANSEAKKINFIKGEAKSYFLFSKIHISKSETYNALEDALKALKLYQKINDYFGIASTYSVLGSISFYKNDADKALLYFNKGLNIAENNKNKKLQADILNNIGNVSYIKGDLEKAIFIYKKAIRLYEILGDKKGAFYPLNNVAVIYNRQGKSIQSLDYFNKCLIINKEQNNKVNIAAIALNMASVYSGRQEHKKAFTYYNESLQLNKELNNNREVSKSLIGLGKTFEISKDYVKASTYYNEALEINKNINSTDGLITSYGNIGSLNLKMNEPQKALINFETCLNLSQTIEDKRSICNSYIDIAETYFILNNYTKALNYALKGKQLAYDLELLPKQNHVNEVLSKIYQATGNYKKALESHQQFKILNDSLFNKENIEKITALEYDYKYKQEIDSAKIRELQLTKTVKKTEQNLEKSQRNYLWAIIGFLLVSLLLSIIIFYLKFKNIKEKTQNIITEQKLLRSQMTPHFIFNSLSVLQGMILNKEDKKSVSYLSKFSKLLRITLENSRDKMVLLSQELIAIENYLALQNLENDSYKYSVTVDESIDVSLFEVPPMLIQPFVENAIEHAFGNQTENKTIDVKMYYSEKSLIATIKDNGTGVNTLKETNHKTKKSLSTTITSERLKIISKEFRMEGSVTIEDRQKFNEKGTVVTLIIPYKKI